MLIYVDLCWCTSWKMVIFHLFLGMFTCLPYSSILRGLGRVQRALLLGHERLEALAEVMTLGDWAVRSSTGGWLQVSIRKCYDLESFRATPIFFLGDSIFVYLVGGDWNMTFIFPYIGNNHPNWLIFFRGGQTTNQMVILCDCSQLCEELYPTSIH